ncbi:MAG: potassium-transporting ATPase subunit KdpA [Aquihabitans sp.]
MEIASYLQIAAVIVVIAATTRLLGPYLANVYDGSPSRADKVFGPFERVIYRVCGIDEDREQRWNVYAVSVLAFSLVSVLFLFALQRVQGFLPFNPNGVGAVPAPLAWNTAVSFVTNTNWQNYASENTLSHFTQMAGLAVQNFVSPVVGLGVAMALVRGIARRRAGTIGNFWVDLVRGSLRVMLPICVLVAVVLMSQGAIQNLNGMTEAHTLEGAVQAIPGGPFASQEAAKMVGTNGGGTLNANSMHPFSNPTGFTSLVQIISVLLIPFALTYAFGRMVRDKRQGWVLFATMMVLWLGIVALATGMEVNGNPEMRAAGVTQEVTAIQGGGNLEGKEVRFGAAGSGVFAASTTGTSTGAVNSAHASYTPLGGMAPLTAMMLGEISPGGVGSGLYGILVFALLAVFIAGLMVGRTPEYLGKKIQAAEMKLVVLFILAVPVAVLGFTAISLATSGNAASILNPGPHGLTEVTYAFTSAGNNNGSAFGGLNGNTDWYNTTLGLTMLVGRFLLIVPVLAIAGSLTRKQKVPASAGTFPTGTPLFAGLLTGVILIVVGLTYFPALALGPIVEHLGLS